LNIADGRLDDWNEADAIQNGPMVRMLSRPAIQKQEIQFAEQTAKVFTGWSDETARFPFVKAPATAAAVVDVVSDTQGFDLAVAYAGRTGVVGLVAPRTADLPLCTAPVEKVTQTSSCTRGSTALHCCDASALS